MTSLGSVKEATHTFPSMDDDAICMAFEGVRGTGGCFGLPRGDCCWALRLAAELAGELLCSVVILLTASTFEAGSGGGNGEMERADMDAEWAW